MQLVILFGAMFVCHILQGILTEYVAHGVLAGLMWAAASIELTVYAALSFTEAHLTGLRLDPRHIPWRQYLLIGACISVGRGLTWVGYGSLSYPTVVLFKSSKIIVVMIAGLVLLRTKHAPAEYAAAVLAVAGLYIFSSAGRADQSEADSPSGFAMMLLAVACEATVSTLQERALKRDQRPLTEMMLVTNALGAALLWGVAAAKGELGALQTRVEERPAAIGWLLLTVVLSYGGSYGFAAAIKAVGAVMATGMGICRKLASVLASYALFPKEMHPRHAAGLSLFFLGLALSWAAASPGHLHSPGTGKEKEEEEERGKGKVGVHVPESEAGPRRETRLSSRKSATNGASGRSASNGASQGQRAPPQGGRAEEAACAEGQGGGEVGDGGGDWERLPLSEDLPAAERTPAPSPPRSLSSSPPASSRRAARALGAARGKGGAAGLEAGSGRVPVGPADSCTPRG